MHNFFFLRLDLRYSRGAGDVPDYVFSKLVDVDLHAASAPGGDAFVVDAV